CPHRRPRWPVGAWPPRSATRREAPMASDATGGKTVLIVEDDPDEREGLAAILSGAGFAVVTAADIPAALAIVRASQHTGGEPRCPPPVFARAAALQAASMAGMESVHKRLLFVCVENSNRSQMAEAFARMHAGDRVEAYSAGSRPSGQVNPKAVAAMRERGYDLTRHASKGLAHLPGRPVCVVVGTGAGGRGRPPVPVPPREEERV